MPSGIILALAVAAVQFARTASLLSREVRGQLVRVGVLEVPAFPRRWSRSRSFQRSCCTFLVSSTLKQLAWLAGRPPKRALFRHLSQLAFASETHPLVRHRPLLVWLLV